MSKIVVSENGSSFVVKDDYTLHLTRLEKAILHRVIRDLLKYQTITKDSMEAGIRFCWAADRDLKELLRKLKELKLG